MKKKITVTAMHIKIGVPLSSLACPIFLAAKGAGLREVSVYCYSMRVGPYKLSLPEKAQDFIRRFDAGEKVAPFSFTVEVWKP